MNRLSRLMNPRAIAVVGGKEAERVIEQCDKLGFDGAIWPVNPTRVEMRGRRCFQSVNQLPGVPDAAYVAVNRERSIDVVKALAQIGCGGAVSYAAGFAEVQQSASAKDARGASLQAQLVAAADRMPLLGPNCYGFINAPARVAMWPDQHGALACERGVAIVTQSSNIAISMTMQTVGLPIAYVATAGNQAQLGLCAIAASLLEDERVTALGLHVEGLDDARALAQLAMRARELRKPLVVLRVGLTDKARATALTHTASLTGSANAFSALLRRLGIASVTAIDTFLQTLLLMHTVGVLPGQSVLSLSCSGGEAALMADALDAHGLATPDFDDDQEAALQAILGDLIHISNPFDYNTFIWGDWDAMARLFATATRGPFDLALLVLDFPRADRCDTDDWDRALEAYVAGVRGSGVRAAVVATLPENLPEPVACRLVAEGVVPLRGIASALLAIRAMADVGSAWSQAPGKSLLPARPHKNVTSPDVITPLIRDEVEAKQALHAFGMSVPRGTRIRVSEDVDRFFAAHSGPACRYVLKGVGLAHKSEHHAVKLGLRDAEAVRCAMQAMTGLTSTFLLEEMIEHEGGVELLVGVTQDTVAGPVLTVGAGGVLTELLQDTASLLLPVTEVQVWDALATLRIAPLLNGFRGRRAVDMDALVANIMAIASYAQAHHPTLLELDVNPLIASADGCVAVDALLIEESPQ